MKKLYRSGAPLRMGLVGGGTDVGPYCDQCGGAVLNVVFSYAYASVQLLDEARRSGIGPSSTLVGAEDRAFPEALSLSLGGDETARLACEAHYTASSQVGSRKAPCPVPFGETSFTSGVPL